MARTHYAKNGEIHIAYHVYGDGPLDLVLCTGAATHLDVLREDPGYRRYCEQIEIELGEPGDQRIGACNSLES